MQDEVLDAVTPATRALTTAPEATPYQLIAQAIDKGLGIDQMERLFDLQQRWEADVARKAYNTAFAAFKAEAVRVLRNRKVTDGPLKGKAYAELHSVVDAVTPALTANGLSASWKNTKDEKDWIEVTCTLRHTGGHSESVSMGGPPDAGGAKNLIMARASTTTYLQRYTLKAICGLAEAGQDDDGRGGASEAGGGEADGDADLREKGKEAAMGGMESLTKWWGSLDSKQRSRLQKDFAAWRRGAQQVSE